MKTTNLFKNTTKAAVTFLFAATMTVSFTACGERKADIHDAVCPICEATHTQLGAKEIHHLELAYERQHFIGKDQLGQYYMTPVGIREYLNGQDKISGMTFKEFMDELNGGAPIIDAKYVRTGKSYNVSQDALGEGFLSNYNYNRTSNYLSPEFYKTEAAKNTLANASELLNKYGKMDNDNLAYNQDIAQ